jgi:hypothetical protein
MLQLLKFTGGLPPPMLVSNWLTCIQGFRFDRLLALLSTDFDLPYPNPKAEKEQGMPKNRIQQAGRDPTYYIQED